eukprot:2427020-Alexandrium_andersonii.AAC.1
MSGDPCGARGHSAHALDNHCAGTCPQGLQHAAPLGGACAWPERLALEEVGSGALRGWSSAPLGPPAHALGVSRDVPCPLGL